MRQADVKHSFAEYRDNQKRLKRKKEDEEV